MVQYGQTKSANCLISVMPVNTDVTKVTYIFLSKHVVPINNILSYS